MRLFVAQAFRPCCWGKKWAVKNSLAIAMATRYLRRAGSAARIIGASM